MPFWLHKSRTMLVLSSYALWQKIVVLILLVALVGFFGFYGCYLPRQRKYLDNKQKIKTLAQQKVLFEQGAERYDQVMQLNTQLTAQMKALITKSYTPQKTMSYLLELLQKYKISCRGIQPLSITPKSFYEKHYVQLAGRGEFGKILAFLREVQDSGIVVKCKSLVLRKDAYRDLKFQMVVRAISVKDG